MVIQGDTPLEIGAILRDKLVRDHHGDLRPLTFRVMREATRAELDAQCDDFGIPRDPNPCPYCYLVSPD